MTAATGSGAAPLSSATTTTNAGGMPLPPNRFELELEFVQSLGSPAYLHYLATSGLLYQSTFLDFLRYLRYWKQPAFAKYLSYPHCLYFLDLLVPPESDGDGGNDDTTAGGDAEGEGGDGDRTTTTTGDGGEAFRREIAQVQFRNFVHEQQFYSWQFRSARLYGKGSAAHNGDDGAGAAAAATGGEGA